MGDSVFDPVWSQRTHSDHCAEILYLIRGTASLEIGPRCYALSAGDLALVPPETPHRDRFDPQSEPEIFLVQFTWEARDFFDEVTNETLAVLADHHRGDLHQLFLQLRDPTVSTSPLDRTYATVFFHALLLRIWRAVRTSLQTDAEEDAAGWDHHAHLMRAARRYLDGHFSEPISLDILAARLQVSPYHLSRVFSRESGFSLIHYLTGIRMQRAMALLRARAGNVSEVSYAVGYENTAYFSRVFKKHFGLRPSQVRGGIAPRK